MGRPSSATSSGRTAQSRQSSDGKLSVSRAPNSKVKPPSLNDIFAAREIDFAELKESFSLQKFMATPRGPSMPSARSDPGLTSAYEQLRRRVNHGAVPVALAELVISIDEFVHLAAL